MKIPNNIICKTVLRMLLEHNNIQENSHWVSLNRVYQNTYSHKVIIPEKGEVLFERRVQLRFTREEDASTYLFVDKVHELVQRYDMSAVKLVLLVLRELYAQESWCSRESVIVSYSDIHSVLTRDVTPVLQHVCDTLKLLHVTVMDIVVKKDFTEPAYVLSSQEDQSLSENAKRSLIERKSGDFGIGRELPIAKGFFMQSVIVPFTTGKSSIICEPNIDLFLLASSANSVTMGYFTAPDFTMQCTRRQEVVFFSALLVALVGWRSVQPTRILRSLYGAGRVLDIDTDGRRSRKMFVWWCKYLEKMGINTPEYRRNWLSESYHLNASRKKRAVSGVKAANSKDT